MAAATIRQFGPYRTIGLTYTAGGGNFDFSGVWDRLMKQIAGRIKTEGIHYFGLCRCIAGASDGTWEYIAAVEVPGSTAVPEGLVEVTIPRADYVVTEAAGLKAIGEAWNVSRQTVAALTGYEPFCGPKGCQCASHPAFEHYAPDFSKTGKVTICAPVRCM